MASATRVCRLCRAVVAPNRSIYLFSASAVKNKWASRIGQLLEIPVDKAITPYMCEMCKGRLINLEKAVADLAAFKDLAKHSREALVKVKGLLKRTRVTSGDVGVSPDTARQRPSSKVARRRLFTCKSLQRWRQCIYEN